MSEFLETDDDDEVDWNAPIVPRERYSKADWFCLLFVIAVFVGFAVFVIYQIGLVK